MRRVAGRLLRRCLLRLVFLAKIDAGGEPVLVSSAVVRSVEVFFY